MSEPFDPKKLKLGTRIGYREQLYVQLLYGGELLDEVEIGEESGDEIDRFRSTNWPTDLSREVSRHDRRHQ